MKDFKAKDKLITVYGYSIDDVIEFKIDDEIFEGIILDISFIESTYKFLVGRLVNPSFYFKSEINYSEIIKKIETKKMREDKILNKIEKLEESIRELIECNGLKTREDINEKKILNRVKHLLAKLVGKHIDIIRYDRKIDYRIFQNKVIGFCERYKSDINNLLCSSDEYIIGRIYDYFHEDKYTLEQFRDDICIK